MGSHEGVVGGVSEIVAVDFKPWWEGIEGTVQVNHATGHLSPREAFHRVLDWEVLSRDVWVDVGIDDEPSKFVVVPNKQALVRADNKAVLGIHSSGYLAHQNEVLCELLEAIKIVDDDVEVASAGGLFGGAVTWMLAKLGEDKHFLGVDEAIARYFAVSTSFDGSMVTHARPTDTRIQCMNTFSMHLRDAAVVSIRHTANSDERIKEAKRTIDSLYAHSEELDREIEQLLSTAFTAIEFKDLVGVLNPQPEGEGVTPLKLGNWRRRSERMLNCTMRDDQQNINGTAWGAIMAINSFENWEQKIQKGSRPVAQARKALTGTYPLTQRARALVAN